MEDGESIRKFFDDYRERYLTWLKWDAEIYSRADRDVWLTMLNHRTAAIDEIYQQNREAFNCVLKPILSGEVPLSRADMDTLYQEAIDMYTNDWADPFLLREVAEFMLSQGYAKDDEREIFLHLCVGFACTEISRTDYHEVGRQAVEHYRTVAAWRDRYATLTDPANRKRIIIAYANLTTVELSLANVTPDEALQSWEELNAFVQTDAFTRFAETEPDTAALAAAYLNKFIATAYFISHETEVSPQILQRLRDMLQAVSDATGWTEDSGDYDADLLLCIQWLHVEQGKITVRQALDNTDAFFRQRIAHPREDDDLISLYTDYLVKLTEWCVMSDLPPEEKQRRCDAYRAQMEQFVSGFANTRDSYTLNNAMQIFAFNPAVLNVCQGQSEKLRFLFHMVISRHITTFLHSLMTARFASRIVRAVLEDRPGLFVGFHGLEDVQDVIEHRDTLVHFAYDAAILHDIGKNGLVDVINLQYRQIGDTEFAIIKTHPRKGYEYLSISEDFWPYRDVALGHHRFYNGQGGYPMDFDNTASPDRIMIDLITLSDCMDAATDHLGRNYKRRKTVPEVIDEFVRGSGTRYNPELVEIMRDNESLRIDLRNLADDRRENICYIACQQYFDEA